MARKPAADAKAAPGAAAENKAATPLMQQYLRIKERYPSDILFFRLGDFYEMFFEDAQRAAPLLEVTLTQRQGIPMCGVPHHAATAYIARLLKAGVSVALAEQLEDPKKTKGMVKRDVVRVITPGTIVEDELLPSKANNFLAAVLVTPELKGAPARWALAAADVSTGRLWAGESDDDHNWNALKSQLAALSPSETLVVGDAPARVKDLLSVSGVLRLEPKPAQGGALSAQAVAAVKAYLSRDGGRSAASLGEPEPLPSIDNGVMFLDETAIRHLELVAASDGSKSGPTLAGVMDRCVTAAGSRLLRWWLLHPSTDVHAIRARHEQVEDLLEAGVRREGLRLGLKDVADLERISVRARAGTASPRDLEALRRSLKAVPDLKRDLAALTLDAGSGPFDLILSRLEAPVELVALLDTQLADEPPAKVIDGHVIRDGLSAELDELRGLRRSGKSWIAQMEADERARTGINSLKVGYNDVFGYYLEVSHANTSKVPAEWTRKQTLTNGERYITPALKEWEEKILGAEDKILALETRLFTELVHQVGAFAPTVSNIADALARLDVAAGLAEVAAEHGLVRPTVTDGPELLIKGGRHLVIERQIGRDRFIPNDLNFDAASRRTAVITGPNMAGKSTYLRQTALIVILAQAGSFVPAESAAIGVVDRLFTRIGASDKLAQGQSTFMVEMQEVATLMAHATPRSLLILDEVGRGTSTYDGVSIAWAVIETLAGTGPRTLFATHYFELTQLAERLPGVFNAHATAKEWTGPDGRKKVVFLYQILEGPADRSYGIHVAEMAGLPEAATRRAREILKKLESEGHQIARASAASAEARPEQLDFFGEHPLVTELRALDVDSLTPLEALNKLNALRKKID